MAKKEFLEEKYCELNQLKNMLQTYPKEYFETIIKVMNNVSEEIIEYLEKEKNKIENKVENKKKNCHRQEEKFTLEQLAEYNGKDGKPSYVAVDGKVYDVSAILQWQSGSHYGLMAGTDLSEYFKGCHASNLNILENAKEIGVIVDKRQEQFRQFTMNEVKECTGLNGKPCYVVVDGTVYDVLDIPCWNGGKHYGLMGGKDLTEYFYTCHKADKGILDKLRIVGTLVE